MNSLYFYYFKWKLAKKAIFHFVTFVFDLVFNNFNLGHNFLMVSDSHLYLTCTVCDKTFILAKICNLIALAFFWNTSALAWALNLCFYMLLYFICAFHLTRCFFGSKIFTSRPWLFRFDEFEFILGHNFWAVNARASIFLACIYCDKTFVWIPKFCF
jgi:hypothetical protein